MECRWSVFSARLGLEPIRLAEIQKYFYFALILHFTGFNSQKTKKTFHDRRQQNRHIILHVFISLPF